MRLALIFLLAVVGAERDRRHKCREGRLEHREEQANMVFTGTVERVYRSRASMYRGAVRIKRVLKGDRNLAENTVIVEGFGDPHICISDVRERDTRIFLVRQLSNGHLRLNSSLVRINVHNLDSSSAAVKNRPYKRRPQISEKPCEKMYCAFGAQCLVDQRTQQAYCRCHETCSDVFAPVCGNDGVAYSSECHLRMASCHQQRRIFVRRQGACDVKDPCQDKECHYGAQCRPSLDGRTAECVCPEKCATYGEGHGARPVCGSDGKNYPNVCELRRAACKEMRKTEVKFQGRCDPCEGVECPASQVCQLDESRNPICRCNAICSALLRPVCGSDGKTYTNECTLRVEACKKRKILRVIYSRECGLGTNPCEHLHCGPGQECDVDRNGIATCHCPPDCEPVMRPVCGSDARTYDSECELKRQACILRRALTVSYRGVCGEKGPCYNHHCNYGGICVVRDDHPVCECPTCSEEFEPVCGTDGISYNNECQLKREACEKTKTITVVYNELCNGCENKKCDYYAVCESDSKGNAKCVCPETCVKVRSTVCGTDGVTYQNECELRVAACKKEEYITVASKGPCDLCKNVHCKYGATCESGRCVCPTDCPDSYEPLCGKDGTTYQNECEMRREACQQGQDISTLFYGECDDIGGSGVDLGSGARGCEDKVCKYGGVCDYDSDGLPHCVCAFRCPPRKQPVCASDGKIYDNDCLMKEEACKQQRNIIVTPMHMCEVERHDVPCSGERPLVDSVTRKEYDCGDGPGSKPCPSGSYCHKTSKFAKCCKEVTVIKSCAEATYGCCADGKTAAQGPRHGGCPSVCNCNRLGSLSQTCDPINKQCPCKPGVGGLQCDRCEPGFWGLHKISEGNSGCVPCACNQYGSVRDDCEQMTGRCVCKHGIQGMKCDICPPGAVLGPDGCVDASIARAVSGSCNQLKCYHGATCREKDNHAQCICDLKCLPEDNKNPVCGSDGNSYGSECQLLLFRCRYQKPIKVADEDVCADDDTSTVGPVRRSTMLKTAALSATKSPRDVTLGLPQNLYLNISPTMATAAIVAAAPPVEVPSFSGRSFLELPRMDANKRLSLEIEFRTFAHSGILLYNGQAASSAGDFVSLAVKDGFVEFKYNLGSGPVTLRSAHRLQPGNFHRVVAKRYLWDGMLALDGHEKVTSRSQGMFKSLDLDQNLFMGFVPTEDRGVFSNIGVTSGFVGCIRRININRKEINLKHPGSKDIIRGGGIRECSDNPCSSMPCLNKATCRATNESSYTCTCLPEFTGKLCETTVDPCTSNPCAFGATCAVLPQGGFSCRCSPGRTGPLCEEVERIPGDSQVPNFTGQSYLELPTLQNVGHALVIEVWFLTRAKNGVLLYNGQLASGRGDFISVNLVDGHLYFRYNLGSGIANITSPKSVSLNKWHSVKITRVGKKGTLQVDDGQTVSGDSKGPLKELNLHQVLFLGGVSHLRHVHQESGIRRGLDGSIQRLVVNGEVWEDLMTRATRSHAVRAYHGPPCNKTVCKNGGVCVPRLNDIQCRCPTKYMGRRCDQYIGKEDMLAPVAFNGTTFLRFPNRINKRTISQRDNHFVIKFRTVVPHGLILWTNKGATLREDYISLALTKGHLELSFNLGKQKKMLTIKNKVPVADGIWHTAVVKRYERLGVLKVDDKHAVNGTSAPGATDLNTRGVVWIGGAPALPPGLPAAYRQGFVGCIDSVSIDGTTLPLVIHEAGNVQFCDGS